MKLKSHDIIILVISILLITGCTSAPVYNVTDLTFPVWHEKSTIEQKDVTKAIMSAGLSLKWMMQEKGDGHIQGTLLIRDHVAIVDIFYDNSKFSIIYNDSKNLDYDGTNIHNQYNNWIRNLASKIQLNISLL